MSAEAKLETDEENYLNSFRPNLMDVVYTWANGANFAHICKMTDVFEGRLISCSLEELVILQQGMVILNNLTINADVFKHLCG